MFSRSEVYTKNLLKVVVAQICQICGWNSIHNSSLEILVNCLDKFMQEISKQTHRISEHCKALDKMFKSLETFSIRFIKFLNDSGKICFGYD